MHEIYLTELSFLVGDVW